MNASALHSPLPPLAADGDALGRALRRAGLTRDSVIRVTGAAGLTAMFWLGRHGYAHAAYVHPGRLATMEPCEALLLPQPCGAAELAELLKDGVSLRPGGVLIAQASPARFAAGADSVEGLFRSRGFALEHDVYDHGLDVYIARRCDGEAKAA